MPYQWAQPWSREGASGERQQSEHGDVGLDSRRAIQHLAAPRQIKSLMNHQIKSIMGPDSRFFYSNDAARERKPTSNANVLQSPAGRTRLSRCSLACCSLGGRCATTKRRLRPTTRRVSHSPPPHARIVAASALSRRALARLVARPLLQQSARNLWRFHGARSGPCALQASS